MNILQVASGDFFSTYGGGQVYVKNIVDEMIRQGLDVVVLSFVGKDSGINECEYKGISLWEIGSRAKESDVEALVQTISPDMIHAHSQKALFSTLSNRLHIPVIITAHHGGILCPASTLMNTNDCICQVTPLYKRCLKCCLSYVRSGSYWYPFMKLLPETSSVRLGEILQKLPFIPFITPIGGIALSIRNKISEWQTICDKATAVIAPSHAIADAMCRNGLSRDKVKVIPHGIPKAISPIETPHNQSDKIRFFYVGRICRVKGLHILLEAFCGIENQDKAELHIIGGAGNKSELRYMSKLQRKYTSVNIVWHGKVHADRVFDSIKDYNVMVHPAIYLEVFGLNIAEALAMNKPVLATRCGGAEMQIVDGINGWLVAPNDIIALRVKMNEIVDQGVKMDTSSLHEDVISIDNHVKDLLKIYEKETFIG